MVVNSGYGQNRLSEMYETIEQPLMMLPELVGLSLNQLKNVLEGRCDSDKSKSIIDAAKLVLGVAAKFKELDLAVVRDVTHIQDVTPCYDLGHKAEAPAVKSGANSQHEN